MAEHETEEQQIQALKDWWKENGRSVIAGVVIGVASLVGWKGWGVYQQQQALEASDRYNNMRSSILAQDINSVTMQAQELKDNYSSTPYAAWGALLLAKAYEANGNTNEAIENLLWTTNNAKQQSVKDLAQLRLARLYVASQDYAKAEAVLDQTFPKAYTSLYQEILGDLHVQRGNLQQAREAYDAAIGAAESGDIEFLKMKRDSLGLSDQANV